MKIEDTSPDMSVSAIKERIAALRKESPNAPKGLPKPVVNQDDTMPLYPTTHNGPADRRWDPRYMITGSGNGPEL